MGTLDHLGQFIDAVSGEASSTQEELVELKTELAKTVVEKMKEKDPASIVGIADDMVVDYLVSEGFFDAIKDNLMGKALELSSLHGLLSDIREKLQKVGTKEQLDQLRSEVLHKIEENAEGSQLSDPSSDDASDRTSDSASGATSDATPQADSNSSSQQSLSSDMSKTQSEPRASDLNSEAVIAAAGSESQEIKDWPSEQVPYIEATLKAAEQQIGKPYIWGAVGPRGFDCSGLWNYAFKEQGIRFEQRFTAAGFEASDVNIPKEEVRIGDFMYWDQDPSKKKKHNPIYHIEMVVGKPYQENGKWYVKTIGSSSDTGILDQNGKKTAKSGVGYRLREITAYRHFGRPPYYMQLAKHETSGDKKQLIASVGKPSSAVQKELMA